MPLLRTYNLFISHAWSYNESYYRLVRFLNEAPNFQWNNLSVPEDKPLATINDEQLKARLRDQMRPADAFLIISGMYANHSDWIEFEVNFADRIGRPIIAIRPWGAQVMPSYVSSVANRIVGWNTDSIVAAVRDLALPTGR